MRVGIAQVRRLENLDAAGQRERLDRALRRTQAPTGGPVRLRKNDGDLVPRIDEPGERPFSECGGACED
jgi:hypothetical protein